MSTWPTGISETVHLETKLISQIDFSELTDRSRKSTRNGTEDIRRQKLLQDTEAHIAFRQAVKFACTLVPKSLQKEVRIFSKKTGLSSRRYETAWSG